MVTYIITSGISVVGASVQWTNLKIIFLLKSNTPSGITTYIELSVMPTPRQPMWNSCYAIFTEDSTCFSIFPVLWVPSQRLTSFIQCRSACLTTSRYGFSTSGIHTNGLKRKMQYCYPCLLLMTSYQQRSHMIKIPNGMGMRWRK